MKGQKRGVPHPDCGYCGNKGCPHCDPPSVKALSFRIGWSWDDERMTTQRER